MIASPVNEPLTEDEEALVGVAAALGAAAVAFADDEEVDVELLDVVVDFLVVVLVVDVAFFVATAAAVGVAVVAVVTAADFVAAAGIEVSAEAPEIVESALLPN